MYLSWNVKKPKTTAKLSKKAETRVFLIIFNSVQHEFFLSEE
jgi:hypothetical protein